MTCPRCQSEKVVRCTRTHWLTGRASLKCRECDCVWRGPGKGVPYETEAASE